MSIKLIRLSSQAKDQLIRLKTKTGITQGNILCRWAFCLSLRQPTPPTPVDIPSDSNVEMSWQVFGGEWQEIYLALLERRLMRSIKYDVPFPFSFSFFSIKYDVPFPF